MAKLRVYVLLALLAFVICLLIWGCSPTKDVARNDRRVSAWMMANPGRAGLKCFQLFRPSDSSGSSLVYRPGVTLLAASDSAVFDPYAVYDVWVSYMRAHLADSIARSVAKAMADSFRRHPLKIACPPHRHTRDTIYKDKFTRIRDRAFETALVDSVGRLSKRLEHANAATAAEAKWHRFWMWGFIVVAGYTLLRIVVRAQWPAVGKQLP